MQQQSLNFSNRKSKRQKKVTKEVKKSSKDLRREQPWYELI